MTKNSYKIPSMEDLGSDIAAMAGYPEVFELPYDEPLTLGFKFNQQMIGFRLEGEFSVELMYQFLSTSISVLLQQILLGKPLKAIPLSKVKIRMNPKRLMHPAADSFQLENSFVQEALSKALPLMLARMQALPWR